MAKNTATPEPFKAGETNARAVRRPADETAVAQTPQRDAKARAAAKAAPTTTAEAADVDKGQGTKKARKPPTPAKPPKPAKPAKRPR